MTPATTLRHALYGAGLGFGVFAALSCLGGEVLKKEALGFGDVWLLSGLGAWMGPAALLPVVLLASLQGRSWGSRCSLLGKGEPGPEEVTASSTSTPTSTTTSTATTTTPPTAPPTATLDRDLDRPGPRRPWIPPSTRFPSARSSWRARSSGYGSRSRSPAGCPSSGSSAEMAGVRAPLRTFLLLHALALAATAGVAVLAPRAAALGAAGARAGRGGGRGARGVAGGAGGGAGAPPPRRGAAGGAAPRGGGAARRRRGRWGELLPLLGEPGGFALSRAAVAFERLALAFGDERERLAAKVGELTAANAALAEARASLLRNEKLATVGRLASGLAHEVGNPLGAISGYVELARARLPPEPHPDLVDALARIDTAAQRIDRTVRDLLDFARPSPPLLAPLDLAAALDGALRLARVQRRFKLVEVTLDLPAGLPPVQADEHHLAQVLLNLLLNAGDAMGGEGHVAIAARAASGSVVLTVQDSGPGIAPGDLPRIFNPFFTTKEPGEGTGLGLALSHRIMESFGGEIAARGAPGGGACFELRFRAGASAPAP